ncbi:asparagine synthase C-terminal domain-containing protein [Jiangella asiatica]|uniref:asparagine synthase (glutamine-hydrolyzing) n=1 Tax=Jiangella asiatica TaxID=2530372 RepID=A0A4R5CFQ3_9ACTN|nr:asparagine synthase C-terminal domain-containing protein [Jiangella asiatica]TDD98958.1 asparagine synthase [Jiangella asiatica]
MSREVLLIAGGDDTASKNRRAGLVAQAAISLPGAVKHDVVETSYATLALVETEIAGGTLASVERDGDTVRVALAITATGLEAATQDPTKARGTAAESGHVAVRLAQDGNVVVSTDGMATVPAYWSERDGQLILSTHLASLVSLGLPGLVDERALFEYLTMLHPLKERTTLRGARLLRPGEVIEWQPDRAAGRSAAPVFVPGDASMSDHEAITACRQVWAEVLEDLFARNRSQRMAVGLSGGLDSRAIVAGAALLGRQPRVFSYGTSNNVDTRIAGDIADHLGMPFIRLPVTDDHLMPRPDVIADRLDGAHSPAEMYESWFAETLRSFADVLVNGAGGGQLWGDEKSLGLTDHRSIAAKVWHRYHDAALAVRPYLSLESRGDLEAEVRAGIDESLEEWDLAQRTDMTVFWRIANRQVRWGNMLVNAARRSGLRLESPFLDSRFIEFASRLSAEQRLNGRLHLQVHRDLFTATADFPRSDDGNSPRHLNHVYWSGESSYRQQLARLTTRHPLSGGRRALRRAVQVGTHTIGRHTPLQSPARWWDERTAVFPIQLWSTTRSVFSERMATLVESTVTPHPVFSQDALDQAAGDLRSGRFSGSVTALARAATAARWIADYEARARAAAAFGR